MKHVLPFLLAAGCFAVAGSARASQADPEPAHYSFLGIDLCFGEQEPGTECDLTIKPRAPKELPMETNPPASATAHAAKKFAATYKVLGRQICLGAVEPDQTCWLRLPVTGESVGETTGKDTRNG